MDDVAFLFDVGFAVLLRRHLKEQAALARNGSLARVANFFFPKVQANEPGCDYLHWLDNSIVRPCCDIHDRCYAKYGCTAQTWWQWWSSWKCDFCNMSVVWCLGLGRAKERS